MTFFSCFFGSFFQPPEIRLRSYLGANLWPKCSQNASRSLPKRSQKVSRGGLCPFVKLCVLLDFGYVLEVLGLPATNKTPTKARGGYGTLKKQVVYRNCSRKRCPRGPNGSPRHLQGGVDEVTFSCFLPSRPQVVPKMAPGEPQGCPEPPQVPTFYDF